MIKNYCPCYSACNFKTYTLHGCCIGRSWNKGALLCASLLRISLFELLLENIHLHLPWNSTALGNSFVLSNKKSKIHRSAGLQVHYSYYLHIKHRANSSGSSDVFPENTYQHWSWDHCFRIFYTDYHFLVSYLYS